MENVHTGQEAFVKPIIHASDAPAAINVTATATVDGIAGGLVTSTSAAAVTITTPAAADIFDALGLAPGAFFDFAIDNSAGANTVTLALDASITAPTGAITGGHTLTVTTTNKVGLFRLYFTSSTTAIIFRIF